MRTKLHLALAMSEKGNIFYRVFLMKTHHISLFYLRHTISEGLKMSPLKITLALRMCNY